MTVETLRDLIDTPATVLPDETLQSVCDATDRTLLPLLTDEDHSDPVLHANCHEAATTVALQIWQSRQAPGGQMVGLDFGAIPTPHLLGPGLISRVQAVLGPCTKFGGAMFA